MVWEFAAMLFWSQRQISNANYTLVFRPRFASERTQETTKGTKVHEGLMGKRFRRLRVLGSRRLQIDLLNNAGRKKGLKNVVGKQSPSRGEANAVVFLLQ